MFLDIEADRYFCLSPAAEQSFARLIDGAPIVAENEAVLANLARHGPLTDGSHGVAIAPCLATVATRTDLPGLAIPPRPAQLMLAAGSLALAPLRLRLFGLAGVIRALQIRKARATSPEPHDRRLTTTAAAFAQLRYVATAHDRCLTRSIALASRLFAQGLTAELILGVQLRPFAAHAWVQAGDRLLNDRVDVVRDFTPILVV
ncbi:lasso peptide biosynthesis B2 protein [Sphingomonas aurantiaca]|uniref:lasso peptide biosynthesis B2 protein n=1 Tax=Sphingomonas aurantiaca TaxID=185949 RepID=UPI002FE00F25